MVTNAHFDKKTTAQQVVDTFAREVAGRTIVITGPSPGGIGAETARAIATKSPKLLILAGRSISKLEETRAAILKETPSASIALVTLDLNSLASVRSAAKDIIAVSGTSVDVLINNAAIMMCPHAVTADGIESQFGTNYVAPWLLTNLLIPALEATTCPRVVFVASAGHRGSDIRWDDVNFSAGKTYNTMISYAQSKSASVLNAVALAEKHPKITAISLHPGSVGTNLMRHVAGEDMKQIMSEFLEADGVTPKPGVFFKDLAQGASTSLVAALDPALKGKTAYLADCQVAEIKGTTPDVLASMLEDTKVAPYAIDPVAAKRLWALTEEMIGEKF